MSNFLQLNSTTNTFVPVCDVEAILAEIKRKDAPQYVVMTREQMEEMLENQWLLALAEERLKNTSGKTYTFDEILAKDGLTRADLADMEDVELE
ncbi:MAG: hypothetical protein FWD35_03280 [Oscillospiraceae bacterium]|nr:hypothetical protein [Oscillospiraceae bacterium]